MATNEAMIPGDVADRLRLSKQGRWYLEHGQVIEITETRRGKWGLGQCHANARWLARRWPDHYRWWTGYSFGHKSGYYGDLLDNHSWVQHADGRHIEVTYAEPTKFYIGAPVFGNDCPDIPSCLFHPNECLAIHVAELRKPPDTIWPR